MRPLADRIHSHQPQTTNHKQPTINNAPNLSLGAVYHETDAAISI
jgi:hypothetical protein